MKIKITPNQIKLALYIYTFILIFVSVFLAFSIVPSTDRTVSARACPGNPSLVTWEGCVSSCQEGCRNGASTDVVACLNGCENACNLICDSDTNTKPPSCNDGRRTCDRPGENENNCPEDCNSNNNPPVTTNPPSCNWCAIYTCSFDTNGDGQCTRADRDSRMEVKQGAECNIEWRGLCRQIDYYPSMSDAEGGRNLCRYDGPGECQDISNTPTNCNESCGPNNQCVSGLTCTNVNGLDLCRLPSNPSSATCQPATVQVNCNETCNTSNRLCPSGLSCTNVNGQNLCRLPSNPSSATCQPLITETPGYSIDKMITDSDNFYYIGEIAIFKIRITNTGSTSLTSIKFRDNYNSNYLTYVGGSAQKSTGGNIADINTVLTRNTAGILEIANITSNSVLGTLAPNAYIDVTLRFIAKAPVDNTCNYGYISAPQLSEISDNSCLISRNIDTDI